MKKLILLVTLIFPLHAETVIDTAAHQKYFDFMKDLRNKADEFLIALETKRKKEVANLQLDGHFNKAQERLETWQNEHSHLADEIDKRFANVDRLIILDGDVLDSRATTEANRIALINHAKALAKVSIENYIDSYAQAIFQK